jgi:hypothetical protein
LFLVFQRFLDHSNQSSYEKVMVKIQTTSQQIQLHTGRTETHTTRMLNTQKFKQNWQQLADWLPSYISPFQVSFPIILDALGAILNCKNKVLMFERDLYAESKPSSESLNLIFFLGAMCSFIALIFCYLSLNMRG